MVYRRGTRKPTSPRRRQRKPAGRSCLQLIAEPGTPRSVANRCFVVGTGLVLGKAEIGAKITARIATDNVTQRSLRACDSRLSVSGCVLGEDEVARSFRVAGGAGFEQRLVARFTVFAEVSEAPSTRCGVLF